MKWIDHNAIEYNPNNIYILFLKESIIPIKNPNSKVIMIIFLYWLGKNSICSGFNIHIMIDPIIIAIGLIIRIEVFECEEEWLFKSGFDLREFLLDKYIIRSEYDAVIPIDEIIMMVSKHSIFDEIIFSIIMSFEKNPEVKGRPIRAALVRPKMIEDIGILKLFFLIIRISW